MKAKIASGLRVCTAAALAVASFAAIPDPALAGGWDRCEASAYNYCMRNWATSGYDNAGECYYGVVRRSCQKEPSPPEGWGWWCYNTPSGTECEQVY